jgi:hypothetical protein
VAEVTKKSSRQPPVVLKKPWDRGDWLCVGVILGAGLIALYCVYIMATSYRGRSIYGGGPDIRMIDVQCQSIVLADDGSELGDKLPHGSCYVDFGQDGGLILEPEWVDRFVVGSFYNVFFTNRPGGGIDKIISWEVRS